MANFNEFKKPKEAKLDHKRAETFMTNIYKTISATKIFEALKNEEYKGVFGIIK